MNSAGSKTTSAEARRNCRSLCAIHPFPDMSLGRVAPESPRRHTLQRSSRERRRCLASGTPAKPNARDRRSPETSPRSMSPRTGRLIVARASARGVQEACAETPELNEEQASRFPTTPAAALRAKRQRRSTHRCAAGSRPSRPPWRARPSRPPPSRARGGARRRSAIRPPLRGLALLSGSVGRMAENRRRVGGSPPWLERHGSASVP
jgi:hypothetical protein